MQIKSPELRSVCLPDRKMRGLWGYFQPRQQCLLRQNCGFQLSSGSGQVQWSLQKNRPQMCLCWWRFRRLPSLRQGIQMVKQRMPMDSVRTKTVQRSWSLHRYQFGLWRCIRQRQWKLSVLQRPWSERSDKLRQVRSDHPQRSGSSDWILSG